MQRLRDLEKQWPKTSYGYGWDSNMRAKFGPHRKPLSAIGIYHRLAVRRRSRAPTSVVPLGHKVTREVTPSSDGADPLVGAALSGRGLAGVLNRAGMSRGALM